MTHLQTLRERSSYLRERIRAKKIVGWETTYDEREHNALEWALDKLTKDDEAK